MKRLIFLLVILTTFACGAAKTHHNAAPPSKYTSLPDTVPPNVYKFADLKPSVNLEFRDSVAICPTNLPGSKLLKTWVDWVLYPENPIRTYNLDSVGIPGLNKVTITGNYEGIIDIAKSFDETSVLTAVMQHVHAVDSEISKQKALKPYDMIFPFSKTDTTIRFSVGIRLIDTMTVQCRSSAEQVMVNVEKGKERVLRFSLEVNPKMVQKSFGQNDNYAWAYIISDGSKKCAAPTWGIAFCFGDHLLTFAPNGEVRVDGALKYTSVQSFLAVYEWVVKMAEN